MKKAFLFLSIFLTATFINAQESGETGAVESEDYKDLEYSNYTGIIQPFDWDDITPDFQESEDHPNGFDGLPIRCYGKVPPQSCFDPSDNKTPIIYISIAKGKTARFTFKDGDDVEKLSKLSPFDELRLFREKEFTITEGLVNTYSSLSKRNELIKTKGIDFSDGSKKHVFPVEVKTNDITGRKELYFTISQKEHEGIYTLVGKRKASGTDETKATWTNILKLHILPYDKKTKEFVYVQLDGGEKDRKEWDPLKEDPDNSITEEKALNYFNKVYRQAAINAKITIGRDKNKDITIDEETTPSDIQKLKDKKFKINNLDLIQVDMTNKNQSGHKYIMISEAFDYLASFGDFQNKNSKYYHIVFAINKQRKTWSLNKCLDKKSDNRIDLTNCNGFRPENEPSKTTYFIERPNEECKNIEGQEPQIIPVTIKKGTKDNNYYIFDDKDSKFKACDILYTDNGFPIIPEEDNLAGVSIPLQKNHLEIVKKRIKSNILEDENLKDDEKTRKIEQIDAISITDDFANFKNYLPYGSIMFVTRAKGEEGLYTLAHELGHSFGLSDVAGAYDYTNENEDNYIYGTTERNVMTWTSPSGSKIRYRDTPIACTMGQNIILKYKIDEKGNICKNGSKCKAKTENAKGVENKLFGYGENQWECMRNCFTNFFDVSKNRENYWKNAGECSSETKTIDVDKEIKNKKLKQIIEEDFLPLKILKAYYTIRQLKNYLTIKQLAPFYTPKELKNAGFSIREIVDEYELETLTKFFKFNELKEFFEEKDLYPYYSK